MAQESSQNFIHEYVVKALNENGFDKLAPEAQKEYLPQFVAQAEQRIGAVLLPMLNEEAANAFAELSQKNNATADDWWEFWNANVPDFAGVVKKTLDEFTQEIKQAFTV